MKKYALMLLVTVLLAGCGQQSVWFEGSIEEAGKTAEETGKLLLVDFYSPG